MLVTLECSEHVHRAGTGLEEHTVEVFEEVEAGHRASSAKNLTVLRVSRSGGVAG